MAGIKKKELEIKLEEIPSHPDPSPDLEQYTTPAHIAADILFAAYGNRHVANRVIADLGCGTGVFALGCVYLGAERVKAVDLDEEAVELAADTAEDWSFSEVIDFQVKDIKEFQAEVDTVIMNPPFGSQNKGADLPFLKKAFKSSETVYSLHNAKTVDFLEKFIKDRGHCIFWEKRYMFEINRQFDYHEKEKENFEVVLLGINIERE
ncbi:MAG: METTL5 family protein [Candidatus Thermoplasmatota archaeon]